MAVAILVGLALRLTFALGYWVGKPLTLDEREYLALARSVAAGRGFAYDTPGRPEPVRRHFGRAPLYPAFVAAVMIVSGTGPVDAAPRGADGPSTGEEADVRALTALKVAQSLVGALGVWLIGLLAARVAGPTAGVAAAAVAAVYPPLVWICSYALSETLYCALALASVLFLDLALARPPGTKGPLVLSAGIVSGLATLTRPAMIVFVLLAGLFLVARRRPVLAALLVAGSLAVLSPWTIRNVVVHGRFVLVASEGGVTFWTGNHPLAIGEGDLAANPAIKQAYVAIENHYPELTAEQLEPVYYREAFRFIIGHPLEWAELMVRKAFYAVVPAGPSYRLHSARYFVASVLSYGLLLPFGVAGIVRLRRHGREPWALWLLASSALLVALVFFPQERFRIPVIDPTLIVCAAAGWALGRLGVAATEVG